MKIRRCKRRVKVFYNINVRKEYELREKIIEDLKEFNIQHTVELYDITARSEEVKIILNKLKQKRRERMNYLDNKNMIDSIRKIALIEKNNIKTLSNKLNPNKKKGITKLSYIIHQNRTVKKEDEIRNTFREVWSEIFKTKQIDQEQFTIDQTTLPQQKLMPFNFELYMKVIEKMRCKKAPGHSGILIDI